MNCVHFKMLNSMYVNYISIFKIIKMKRKPNPHSRGGE